MGKRNEITLASDTPKTSLEDFILPSLTRAFCAAYQPLSAWQEGCEVFTQESLRHFFKAVVCPLGDPLAVYMQTLEDYGFRMQVDFATGEPVIYAIRRNIL